MEHFLREYPDKQIAIIWDNAAFHKSKEIRDQLKKGGIMERVHLIPMPPYAPDENPIEHVWNTAKQDVANIQRGTFEHTKQAFSDYIASRLFHYVFASFWFGMAIVGHIADACWASKYDCLAELHPNTTSVIFIQNTDNNARRMAGATFLIETTSAEGEPLLVIRGLNPLENIINDLDQKSFVDEFTAYTREIANNQGRKLAIVIDDHSGGSCTNRPSLFAY